MPFIIAHEDYCTLAWGITEDAQVGDASFHLYAKPCSCGGIRLNIDTFLPGDSSAIPLTMLGSAERLPRG